MRTEGRIYTSIWDDDPDWTARTFGAQWAYTMLLSQQDLEHHGGIALRIPRWSQLAHDMTEPMLTGYIDELAEHRFIVVDRDYGELFVRALIRQDRVYKQPNVLRSAADRLSQVRSPTILAAMHAELLRVDSLPDLTETCRLIVKEMLDTTLPGAPRPTIRRSRRLAKPHHHPADDPSPTAAADPSANAAANPSRKGSPDPSSKTATGPSTKAAAYRPPKPTGKASATPSTTATSAQPSATAQASQAPSPTPRPNASDKGSPNPTGNPSTQSQPQPRPDPSPRPSTDASDDPRPDHQQILATWLHGTGPQTPGADLVAAVERVLADALHADEPAKRVAEVVARWQQEDGTDPARLTTMIANASDSRTPANDAKAADSTATTAAAPAKPKPLGGWELNDLELATVAITDSWLATLAVKPTDQMLEDIEYHISSALIAGHRPKHIAAVLAAWHASDTTDTRQLTDLIDAPAPTGDMQPQAADTATTSAPTSAEEWLSTAKADR